jgi:hypothetical protein
MDGIDLGAPEFGGVFLKIQHDGKINDFSVKVKKRTMLKNKGCQSAN